MEFVWVALFLAAVFGLAIWRAPDDRAAKADGSYALRFVYIENDGSARSLTDDEVGYLNSDFHPADGNRPYIKSRYRQRTPTGELRGFLLRSELPKGIELR